MSDATHGLPIYQRDPDFGRAYRGPGESVPNLRLPAGWWLLPAVVTGAAGWVALFWAIFL